MKNPGSGRSRPGATSSDDLATQLLGLSVRSRLLARKGDISAALALAEQVDRLARTWTRQETQADAALNRAEINYLAGNLRAPARCRQAIDHYLRKGATAYVARARRLAAAWTAENQQDRESRKLGTGTASGLSQSA